MDMEMTSQATPFNINEPYANNLVTIIASIIAFLTVRHIFIYFHNKCRTSPRLRFIWSLTDPLASRYKKVENSVVNKFSYSAFNGICPPLGAFFLVCALTSAVLPLLLLNNDLKVNSNRAGFLSLAIVPFLLSSTGKNSAVSFLTGISSVKMNFLHRMLGMALIICATVHMSCMIYSWAKFPSFLVSQMEQTKVQYGLAGYGCLCVVILGSILPVRTYCYELFLGTHLLGIAFIGVIAVHTPYAMRYFFSGLFCYALNLVALWCVKTYMAQARFEVLPEGCTKISIRLSSPMKTHHIGQHINLCIPAISSFQWHPFTITSVQQPNAKHQNSIEVCVIARGDFTNTLYRKVDPTEELRVFVSGPFGSKDVQSMDILSKYTSVVIASGGAGVTFGMRLLRELSDSLVMYDESNEDDDVEKDLLNHWKTKDIFFYWCVKKPLELEWFREELQQLNYLYETHTQFPQLHIKFHVTFKDTVTVNEDAIRPALESQSAAYSNNAINEIPESQGFVREKSVGNPKKSIEICEGRLDSKSLLSIQSDMGVYGNQYDN
jgi:predicted ferric reductase